MTKKISKYLNSRGLTVIFLGTFIKKQASWVQTFTPGLSDEVRKTSHTHTE